MQALKAAPSAIRLFKYQRPEIVDLVKAGAHRRPGPAGLTVVVVHAIEIGPPRCSWLRRHVLQRGEQCKGNEELGRPAGGGAAGRFAAPLDAGRLLDFPLAVVMPGPPTEELAAEIGDQNRKLIIQRRDFVFEIN